MGGRGSSSGIGSKEKARLDAKYKPQEHTKEQLEGALRNASFYNKQFQNKIKEHDNTRYLEGVNRNERLQEYKTSLKEFTKREKYLKDILKNR